MPVTGECETPTWERIVAYLRCPRCGASLDIEPDGVGCAQGHHYPGQSGYLDFSAGGHADRTTERTFSSFGYEWNAFDAIRDEDESFAAVYFKDLDFGGLAGRVGLDAGCGKGRFTRVLARHLKTLIALDGSEAVDAAARNLRDAGNVGLVRADLRTPLFAPESLDFIASLGVLHHLDDPRDGFEHLAAYLAPGGQMLLYLYSRPDTIGSRSVALALASMLRRATIHLPHPFLKVLSGPIAAVLEVVVVGPGLWGQRRGIAALSRLPMSTYRDKPFRSLVLDTFDRLSAPVEHRYVWAELEPWFAGAGLVVDAARDETGWFVLAHRA
jgi:SAM-dependent methyltransferase